MNDTRLSDLPYVAVRWPANHIVFHLLCDHGEEQIDELRERVVSSVREALAAMDIRVVETARPSPPSPPVSSSPGAVA